MSKENNPFNYDTIHVLVIMMRVQKQAFTSLILRSTYPKQVSKYDECIHSISLESLT